MKHHAPVSGDQLHRVLTDLGWEIRNRPGARPLATWLTAEVPIPEKNRKQVADDRTIKQLADAMGIPKSDLLDVFLGRSPIKGGKPKAALEQPQPSGPSKADARAVCSRLREQVDRIDEWLAHGSRDPDTYRRVMSAISGALGELRGLPPQGDTWTAPDDTGFKPAQPDSVTTGVARAVGVTAQAVRRGHTLTRFQYDEREK